MIQKVPLVQQLEEKIETDKVTSAIAYVIGDRGQGKDGKPLFRVSRILAHRTMASSLARDGIEALTSPESKR